MSKYPLISIVTPCLNAGEYIRQSVLSIIGQDYPAVEHILIDGGSTDDTLKIIDERRDRIAVIISEKDSGTSDAINKGFRIAKGEFVWLLNADDMLVEPNALSLLSDYLIKNPDCDFVFGNTYMVNSRGEIIGHRIFDNFDLTGILMDRRHPPLAGCLLRKSALEDIGYFDERFKYANDIDFYLRLATSKKLGHLDVFTGIFKMHPESSAQSHLYETGSEIVSICLDYLERNSASSNFRVSKDRIKSAIYVFAAGYCFHTGRVTEARRFLSMAVRSNPMALTDIKVPIYFWLSLLGNCHTECLARKLRGLTYSKNGYPFYSMLKSTPY